MREKRSLQTAPGTEKGGGNNLDARSLIGFPDSLEEEVSQV